MMESGTQGSGRRWLARLGTAFMLLITAAGVVVIVGLLWLVGQVAPGAAPSQPPAESRAPIQAQQARVVEAPMLAPSPTVAQRAARMPNPRPPHAPLAAAPAAPGAVAPHVNSDSAKNHAIAQGLTGMARDPDAAKRFGVPP